MQKVEGNLCFSFLHTSVVFYLNFLTMWVLLIFNANEDYLTDEIIGHFSLYLYIKIAKTIYISK